MRIFAALLLLAACTAETIEPADPIVTACRADADALCERIGYGDSELCRVVMRRDCSDEDAEEYEAFCRATRPEVPADAPCELVWR